MQAWLMYERMTFIKYHINSSTRLICRKSLPPFWRPDDDSF